MRESRFFERRTTRRTDDEKLWNRCTNETQLLRRFRRSTEERAKTVFATNALKAACVTGLIAMRRNRTKEKSGIFNKNFVRPLTKSECQIHRKTSSEVASSASNIRCIFMPKKSMPQTVFTRLDENTFESAIFCHRAIYEKPKTIVSNSLGSNKLDKQHENDWYPVE